MATENHIINKVSMQLIGVTTQSAFQLQQDLSQYLLHALPAKLDRWLDANFPPGQWIAIDTLKINIETEGMFSQKKLEAVIEEALQKQLVERAQSIPGNTSSSQPVSPFRAWLHFMESGRLPWWYAGNAAMLEDEVMAEWKTNPVSSESLLQEAIGKEMVRQRLVMQSSPRLFAAVLTVLRITKFEWEQWEKEMAQAVDDKLENDFRWQTEAQYRNTITLANRYAFLQRVAARRHRSLSVDERTVLCIVSTLEKAGLQTEAMLRKLDDLLLSERSAAGEKEKREAKRGEEVKHIMVNNAGLVLFHPYLDYFFRAMGVLNKTGSELLFPGKAIQLLHYLATGKTVCAENETVLNKILCGIGEEEAVYTQYPVSPEEETECRSLLEAVIRNWPALKNTSPEGLQETFVQRTGKLSWKDGHWLLQVEQKTVDVLLNKLQWPLSVIRLPWMQAWLQVEWA